MTATTANAVAAEPRADAAAATMNAEAAENSADKNKEGSRPPLPAGFLAFENEERERAEASNQQRDAPKNPNGKNVVDDRKSTTSVCAGLLKMM